MKGPIPVEVLGAHQILFQGGIHGLVEREETALIRRDCYKGKFTQCEISSYLVVQIPFLEVQNQSLDVSCPVHLLVPASPRDLGRLQERLPPPSLRHLPSPPPLLRH